MRLVRSLCLLIAAVVVMTPFVWASTGDAWIEGIHDAETDGVFHAVVSTQGVAPDALLYTFGHIQVVSTAIPPSDEAAATTVVIAARRTRAPPLA
jgi:hypothetical protein